MSGWPSGLRRQTQEVDSSFSLSVLVHECGRGFESHFWQNPFFIFIAAFISFFLFFGHFHSPKCSFVLIPWCSINRWKRWPSLFFCSSKEEASTSKATAFFSFLFFFWEMDGGEAIHCSSPLCLMRHGRREMSPTSGLSWSFVVTMSTPPRLSNWQSIGPIHRHWLHHPMACLRCSWKEKRWVEGAALYFPKSIKTR